MKQLIKTVVLAAVALTVPFAASASPEDDRKAFVNYFKAKFPGVPDVEYSNGVYAIDPIGRESWEAIEEFPPYETFIIPSLNAIKSSVPIASPIISISSRANIAASCCPFTNLSANRPTKLPTLNAK